MNAQEKDPYFIKVPEGKMSCPHKTILVRMNFANQYRIIITDTQQPDSYAPPGHGAIIQSL